MIQTKLQLEGQELQPAQLEIVSKQPEAPTQADNISKE